METANIPDVDEPSWLPSEAELLRSIAQDSLAEFLKQAWPIVEPSTPLIWGRHLDALCLHLEAISRGELQNLAITVPPGSTKSITCGVVWPAWTWIKRPGLRFLTASNESDLVIRDAVACRRLIESPWYRENWGHVFKLTSDQNVKSWYENNQRGFRTATTVGSNVTGKKGDILLVDDANDAQRVESEAERTKVNGWWDKAFYNRVNNYKKCGRVLIGQRTHEEDLIGHVLQQGGFEHLCIPEEFEPERRCTTSIGWTDWREMPGELLRPDRFGPEQIAEAKRRLLARGYAAQHQQRPVPLEGNLFKRDWLRYYVRRGDYYVFGGKLYHPNELHERFLTVDTASTEQRTVKHDPDWTVISSWAITPCQNLLWLGCLRFRAEGPDIPGRVGECYLKFLAKHADVEGGGKQKDIVNFIRRHDIGRGVRMNVVEFVPTGDKIMNSIDARAAMESGRVYLPTAEADQAFPLAIVETELLRFQGGGTGHDDIVDTLSRAAKRLMQKETLNRTTEIKTLRRSMV